MQSLSRSNNWFVCPQPVPGAETRLFLFPYAGGGPGTFGKWLAGLPGTIETYSAHYPGRGSRHSEPAINRVSALVEGLNQAIQPLLDKPFAFFGHSLGGLVAFELARKLRQQNVLQLQILFVSACGAPHLPDPHPPIHALPDAQFLAALHALNGIPAGVLDLPDLMDLLIPALRADFEAVERYVYTSDAPLLNCPIVAFGGLDDPRVSQERLDGWALHTNADFKSQYFPGDHFFINSEKKAILRSIANEITIFAKRKHEST